MSNTNGFKLATLAASIALAMASTVALAAAPTATQLPGAGNVATGSPALANVGTISAGKQTLTLGVGNTVINWGVASGATINATSQPGGFNIGSGAGLTFDGNAGANSVLNVDVSGNASQIFGALSYTNGTGNLYVANSNGIIVGATATISNATGGVGLIANSRGTIAFNGSASATSIEYTGTGGDVTVQTPTTGHGIHGTSVLVSGGGVVNVDLSAFTSGAVTLKAGVMNSTSSWAGDNTDASLTAAGAQAGGTLASFASAGNASSSGTLTLGSNARVDGTLTNTGALTLDTRFHIAGALVNNKTATQLDDVSMGSLTNSGAYAGGSFSLTTTDGGLSNVGSMTDIGYVQIENGGDFVNNGQFTSSNGLDVYGGGNVTNNGKATLGGYVVIREGGNFINAGTMSLTSNVYVLNGSIANSGTLGVGYYLITASDTTAGLGYAAGADYSITNTGTVTSAGDLLLYANSDYSGSHNGAKNTSTGSVSNTGVLQVGTSRFLELDAYNDVNLAGMVQALSGSKYKALSATNPLSWLGVYAGDYDGTAALNTDGVATVSTDITTSSWAQVYGNQVKLLSNLSVVDATGTPVGTIDIVAGAASTTDYAVRVASGKTVTAGAILVSGDQSGDEPNVILQGTLAAEDIGFGVFHPVSDVFSGPAGGLSILNIELRPYLSINSTGRVKTVPYNNAPNNFRFNGLSVNVADGSTLSLDINPSGAQGTPLSGVNLLVNSDVMLWSSMSATVHAGDSAVTGVTNIPNTHLVLQSSGNIEVGNGDDFYWPGYVYLGNVAADANGNALPGTLGLGTITTDGEFNNVLSGDIAGASGIHFITQFPLILHGNVVTNANAWVSFGTDLLTDGYANGLINTNGFGFYGGKQGSGNVVNYGKLAASNFVSQAPSDTP